jgi:hypothetical protein
VRSDYTKANYFSGGRSGGSREGMTMGHQYPRGHSAYGASAVSVTELAPTGHTEPDAVGRNGPLSRTFVLGLTLGPTGTRPFGARTGALGHGL